MQKWLPHATWQQVPGGLYSDLDFLKFMYLVKSQNCSRHIISIFGKLGFNNHGQIEAKTERKVLIPMHSSEVGPVLFEMPLTSSPQKKEAAVKADKLAANASSELCESRFEDSIRFEVSIW